MLNDLYVVRHAEAIPRGSLEMDDHRWLTSEGRVRFYQAARRLRKKEGRDAVDLILVSPLVRTVMTAELLARALRLSGPVEVCAALSADASAAAALDQVLLRDVKRVAVVGHEPMMSELLRRLAPTADIRGFEGKMPKGGIAALRLVSGTEAKLRYLLTP